VCKPSDVEYGKGEWRFLSTIANHLSMTLENAELYHFATTDQLTGLFNRRYFKHRLEREAERALRRGRTFSLIMYDIDHFKQVNDTYGHPAGDQVLAELSHRVHDFFEERGFTCRYGGEEFVSVAYNADARGGAEIAEQVRRLIADTPFRFTCEDGVAERTITVSLGVVSFPNDSTELDALIAKADQALYLAKAQGRNRVVARVPQ